MRIIEFALIMQTIFYSHVLERKARVDIIKEFVKGELMSWL